MSLLSKSFSSKSIVAGSMGDESARLIGWKDQKSPPVYGVPRAAPANHRSFQKNWAALSSTLRERTMRRRMAITESERSDTDWGVMSSETDSDGGLSYKMREVDEETVEAIPQIVPESSEESDDCSEFSAEDFLSQALSERYQDHLIEPVYIRQNSIDDNKFHNTYSTSDMKDSGFQSMLDTSVLRNPDSKLDVSTIKVQCNEDGTYRQLMTSDELLPDLEALRRLKHRRVFDQSDGLFRQEMTEDERFTEAEETDFCKAIDKCFDEISYQSNTDVSDHTYEAIHIAKDSRNDEDDLIELCRLAVEILSHKEISAVCGYDVISSEHRSMKTRSCRGNQYRRRNSDVYSASEDSLSPQQICQSRKRIFEEIVSSYGSLQYPPKSASVTEGICQSRTEIYEALSRNSSIACSQSLSESILIEIHDNFLMAPKPLADNGVAESLYNVLESYITGEEKCGRIYSSDDGSVSLPPVSSTESLTFTEIFANQMSHDVIKLADAEDESCSSTDDGFYNVPKHENSCSDEDDLQPASRPKRRVAFHDEVRMFEVETENAGGDGFKKKEKRKEEKQKTRFEVPQVMPDFSWSDISDDTKSDFESSLSSCGDSCSCSSSSVELQSTSLFMRLINSFTHCHCIGVGSDYDQLLVRDGIRTRKSRRKRRESYDSGISRSESETSLEKLPIDWYGSEESSIDIDRTLSILEEKAKQCEEKLIKQLAKSLSDGDLTKIDDKVKDIRKEGWSYQKFYKRVRPKEKWIKHCDIEEETVYDVIDEVKLEKEMSHWRDGESPSADSPPDSSSSPTSHDDGKHSLLQFAMQNFRQVPGDRIAHADESDKKKKSKKPKEPGADWTWKQQVDMVKFSKAPINASLLRLDSSDLSKLAVECFLAIMRYMGDLPMGKNQSEVDCVYTLLMNCHKHTPLRDEVYCQLMKQTTNNKSQRPDSCQRGWRLLCIVAAYFDCSQVLQPYLLKYLESAAYDKRRAYHGTALVCLQNLRKTIRYGGRKNVPSIEEITALTAGRNAKRQIYQLPGGTERIINTKSTTVVQDIIEEICSELNVRSIEEMEEFSLYCIVEGDTFTMPLAREEYILDVTTELHKNQQVFYLIFCRSVWHHQLRLDNPLYIEVAFNQIAPDYLEGLLLVMPGETLSQESVYDIAKIAALLHRAPGLEHVPNMKETKFLLPKPALAVRDIKPPQWVSLVQSAWKEVDLLKPVQSKAQVLEILQRWPLFGSSFFAVKRVAEPGERAEHILALNRQGVHFLDVITHETLIHYPFSEVISTRKVKSEDGALFLDMKCGNLMQQRITRIQTDQAHEISRLIRQYITIEQRQQNEKPRKRENPEL